MPLISANLLDVVPCFLAISFKVSPAFITYSFLSLTSMFGNFNFWFTLIKLGSCILFKDAISLTDVLYFFAIRPKFSPFATTWLFSRLLSYDLGLSLTS